MSSGGGGGGACRPAIGSVSASISLTTLNTGWRCFIDGGSVSLQDNFPREAVQLPDVAQVQVGSAGRRDSSSHLAKVCALAGGVNNHHDCIIASRLREFDNEVYAHRLPAVVRRQEGLEFSDRQSALGFGAEAEVAGPDVAADVSRHIGPPIVARDQFQGLEPTGVAGHLGVVAEGDDVASKVRAVWDVDVAAKVQEAIPVGPFL